MGFNLGGLGDKVQGLMNSVKDGNIGELLQKLPLDQLPLDQLLQKLPVDQLLSSSFLQQFTPFQSLKELLQSGGFTGSSAEDLKSLPQDQLNEHVNQTTSFGSLKDMLVKAAEFYTQRK
ncbi:MULTISPECIES: hypothetical protein [unclassified Paenibacillus]|uniref:hypothetical protein n=1 Tax=unclassified Paenibacillus TaxID=185978 RepID=UPI002406E8DA|nr:MULTISPECIES: hypothetical protein [unclassified Paenibacillus]MDF9841152.1 hypothetical protein [Paenibacillus sp. PastF-2]MDF9847676.1 hypothetical protein [Paenibacillus sp. PastM-2]MDF9854245.1 hypothetical protein [Paenibacillus sp. PastF-1]MDH6479584.1 hypothetical protein [Paenibacillus sp. PastH-2]MDH6505249.1 hypothetical protein [Paenibacillus sp. PastM-3]